MITAFKRKNHETNLSIIQNECRCDALISVPQFPYVLSGLGFVSFNVVFNMWNVVAVPIGFVENSKFKKRSLLSLALTVRDAWFGSKQKGFLAVGGSWAFNFLGTQQLEMRRRICSHNSAFYCLTTIFHCHFPCMCVYLCVGIFWILWI